MKEYVHIVKVRTNQTAQRLRVEGDGCDVAYVIIEEENALSPHNWVEVARFSINRKESGQFGHATGLIGYA